MSFIDSVEVKSKDLQDMNLLMEKMIEFRNGIDATHDAVKVSFFYDLWLTVILYYLTLFLKRAKYIAHNTTHDVVSYFVL